MNHYLMSISGLHITMLASLGFALTYWLWRRSVRLTLWLPARNAAVLIALLVALGYALLSGFGVTAQRTVNMVGAVAAALWLNQNFHSRKFSALRCSAC
jgi:competence protein ComEC